MSYFLADRTDGLGSRINAILNAMFLANEFKDLKAMKFIYTLRSESEKERTFEDNEIIKGSVDDLSCLFDDEFIKNHYLDLDEIKNKSTISVCAYKDMQSLKEAFENCDYDFFTVPIGFLHWYIKDINHEYYRKKTCEIFEKIGFRTNIKQTIKKAKKQALDLNPYVAIHYRTGDGIYGYTPIARLTGKALINFCSYFELILATSLKVLAENKKVIVVGDDQTSVANLKLQDSRIYSVTEFRDINEYSNTELFFYDVVLMSCSTQLYWSGSALCKTAYLINPKVKLFPLQNVFLNKEKLYQIVKYYHFRNNLSNYQKAYSLFHLFILAKQLGENTKIILEYLKACLELDYENDKYRIYYIDELLSDNQIERAEEFLRITLELRKENFIQTLSSWYPTPDIFAYGECFENYLRIDDYKSFPCLYFIKLYIMKNCYKQEISEKIIDLNFIYNQKKPSLEESYRTIIHNHLAYKLGQSMIKNSKSFLSYMKMPFILKAIEIVHRKEQKLYQEKIQNYPALKLPPIESYPDYKEALKEKECFTYKLGLALMKAHKKWYGGGYLVFFFKELPKLKEEFKRKKELDKV